MIKISFEKLDSLTKNQAAYYEIHIDTEVLKVGVAKNIIKRLKQHRASRQSGLKQKNGGAWDNPSNVRSKSSILTKHLYYDQTISDCDLTKESERRLFLENRCTVYVLYTDSREEAKILEKKREASNDIRYCKQVKVRKKD